MLLIFFESVFSPSYTIHQFYDLSANLYAWSFWCMVVTWNAALEISIVYYACKKRRQLEASNKEDSSFSSVSYLVSSKLFVLLVLHVHWIHLSWLYELSFYSYFVEFLLVLVPGRDSLRCFDRPTGFYKDFDRYSDLHHSLLLGNFQNLLLLPQPPPLLHQLHRHTLRQMLIGHNIFDDIYVTRNWEEEVFLCGVV